MTTMSTNTPGPRNEVVGNWRRLHMYLDYTDAAERARSERVAGAEHVAIVPTEATTGYYVSVRRGDAIWCPVCDGDGTVLLDGFRETTCVCCDGAGKVTA